MADRYIVITGAASGIGYAVAESQLRCCNKVIAVDLNADRLLERFGDNPSVKTIACDLTTDEGFKYLTSEIKAACDGVGGFVHAAGIDVMAPMGLIRPAVMHKLFSIHAVFPVCFLGWMAKKGNHSEGASCVLISSLSATALPPSSPGYQAWITAAHRSDIPEMTCARPPNTTRTTGLPVARRASTYSS